MDIIDKNKEEMLKKKTWAVIGVTVDPQKFGYKIYKKLQKHNYTVYGVNPKYDSLNGEKIYASLKDLPEKPDCVNVVVNPKVAKSALDVIKELGIEYVWFQPGTFTEEVIQRAEDYGLKIVFYDCILVELNN